MGTRDDKFWAEFLGVDPQDWSTPGVLVRPQVGLRGYQGIWCFRRNRRAVISAPSAWVERLLPIASRWDPDQLMAPSSWAEILGGDLDRVIGPAFQGCLEPTSFSKTPQELVRPLVDPDLVAMEQFRSECGLADWRISGLDEAELWRHAYFADGLIVAAAGYRPWSDDAGDPCILTHPHYRARGRGAAVAGAVVEQALAQGKLLLYQTLEANEAAVRLALSLGYERYANHLAVRLRREKAEP